MTQVNKTILVTGTSSGIGKATAVYLAKKQFTVLASVRKDADATMLQSYHLPNLIPICPLDLTNKSDIERATQTIIEKLKSKKIPPIFGVVFIAGGGKIAPIELMNIEDFRIEMEKRVIGNISVLQKMLPYLRQTRGRIIWIATPGLLPSPYIAEIHAPDFAVNYLARSLNLELQSDGIRNVLVRCGGIDTPSPKRTEINIVEQFGNLPKEEIEPYKNKLQQFEESLKRFAKKRTNPEKVAIIIEKALTAKKPKVRYQVGHMSKAGAFLEKLPQNWIDGILLKRECVLSRKSRCCSK